MLFFPAMVATYAAYLWRLEHLGHNWNLIMASPCTAAGPVCRKVCGGGKAGAADPRFCVRAVRVLRQGVCPSARASAGYLAAVSAAGALGALAVIAAQLVLAMVIRSFAVPIFLGLLGGITGIFISSKGHGLLWPYSLMCNSV